MQYLIMFGFVVAIMGVIVNVIDSKGLSATTVAASTSITEDQVSSLFLPSIAFCCQSFKLSSQSWLLSIDGAWPVNTHS